MKPHGITELLCCQNEKNVKTEELKFMLLLTSDFLILF